MSKNTPLFEAVLDHYNTVTTCASYLDWIDTLNFAARVILDSERPDFHPMIAIDAARQISAISSFLTDSASLEGKTKELYSQMDAAFEDEKARVAGVKLSAQGVGYAK